MVNGKWQRILLTENYKIRAKRAKRAKCCVCLRKIKLEKRKFTKFFTLLLEAGIIVGCLFLFLRG